MRIFEITLPDDSDANGSIQLGPRWVSVSPVHLMYSSCTSSLRSMPIMVEGEMRSVPRPALARLKRLGLREEMTVTEAVLVAKLAEANADAVRNSARFPAITRKEIPSLGCIRLGSHRVRLI